MRAIFESVFDAVYLITVISLGFIIIRNSAGEKQYRIFGIMAILLGFGDAFHLVPRAYALLTTGLKDYTYFLGVGKFITSITMTVFYVLLYHAWKERYHIKGYESLTWTVYILAAVRVILCLFPQNNWTEANPSVTWGIYRNIPFLIMGIIVIILFFKSSRIHKDTDFKNMWLTIVLSFGFYIPVVLFADANETIGLLMIPKTLAYVWTVLIGYNSMKRRKTDEKIS